MKDSREHTDKTKAELDEETAWQVKMGKLSVWCAGAGICVWLLFIPLVSYALSKIGLYDETFAALLLSGGGLQVVAVLCGLRSRSLRIGKVGLIAGLTSLCLLVGLYLVAVFMS